MALEPLDEIHALQIQAGILGRRTGHMFEDAIAEKINTIKYPMRVESGGDGHVYVGNPAISLLDYIARSKHKSIIKHAVAISTGALATSQEGIRWLNINGVTVAKCKSDLVITIEWPDGEMLTAGISTKQCNNKTPTNAQLYFTTAQGFANLLTRNGILVSSAAVGALKQFCGDSGYRPLDNLNLIQARAVDPRRWFWEEIEPVGRTEWESLFALHQNHISRLLLQKAYLNDPFVPDFLLHKTKLAASWNNVEVALYGIDELVRLSQKYSGFSTKSYSVRKGSFKDPVGVTHEAPRFGIIQMQRGGQAQHPTQLQFNLSAGYFYRI